MGDIKKVIFVAGSGTCRAPMAAGILRSMPFAKDLEVCARGLVVLFPEPMNQKAEAVMISNGITWDGFMSQQLEESDITDHTLILTMDAALRQKVIDSFEGATEENTRVLSAYVGDEIEIVDPYGGSLQTYGLCFEVMKRTMEKLEGLL